MKPIHFLLLICLLACLACHKKSPKNSHLQEKNQNQSSANFQGKITAVKDGDTFKVLCQKQETTIRLAHVDCPEKKQAFGKNAKQMASDLCFGKTVNIVSNGKQDRYHRLIAEVYVGDVCVNKTLVKNGLAWHYIKYSSHPTYAALQKEAQENKRGLWAENQPIAPWDFRKNKKKH